MGKIQDKRQLAEWQKSKIHKVRCTHEAIQQEFVPRRICADCGCSLAYWKESANVSLTVRSGGNPQVDFHEMMGGINVCSHTLTERKRLSLRAGQKYFNSHASWKNVCSQCVLPY